METILCTYDISATITNTHEDANKDVPSML